MKAYWFKGINTPEKAKKRWHELCRKYHADTGGDPATMQQINAEYQSLVTAFAWKEEWENEGKKTPRTKGKRPKKEPVKSTKVVSVAPVVEPDDEMDKLIDVGTEFGKLLLKKIWKRRTSKSDS